MIIKGKLIEVIMKSFDEGELTNQIFFKIDDAYFNFIFFDFRQETIIYESLLKLVNEKIVIIFSDNFFEIYKKENKIIDFKKIFLVIGMLKIITKQEYIKGLI